LKLNNIYRFIVNSYLFRIVILTTLGLIILFQLYNKIFDDVWRLESYLPVTNLHNIYTKPIAYDNETKIKLKLIDRNKIAIEGNKRLRIINNKENYDYYDTTKLVLAYENKEQLNKIFLQIENSTKLDSLYLVITITDKPNIFWNQIFYSSILVSEINEFSKKPEEFRINFKELVNENELKDNDSLINAVLYYFNSGKDTLKLSECGINSQIFKNISDRFNLPCRVIGLQGGDANQPGYFDKLGYPTHALCEVYSSKQMKWYVIDPTYGFRFKNIDKSDYLNAVEISDKYFFNTERTIVQDSILQTKRTSVGRDYFKYYENVFYIKSYMGNKWVMKLLKFLFNKGDYYAMQYTNNMNFLKNTYNYFGIKTIGYLVIIGIHFNLVSFFIMKRLYKVKKPKKLNQTL
jgi:hypothetical protein